MSDDGLNIAKNLLREREYHFAADSVAEAIEELRILREVAHKYDQLMALKERWIYYDDK